jgi:hypothetical protein
MGGPNEFCPDEAKYDLVIKITYNTVDPGKTVIKTNIKKEDLEDILDTWLRGQFGQGEDKSEPNRKDKYQIDIRVDLSYDRFNTVSDTGNKSLTCGIVMQVIGKLGKITILDLDEKE